jgi:hypothetical protein
VKTTRLCELQFFLFYLEVIKKYGRSACAAPDHCIAPHRAFAVAPSHSIANAPSKAYVSIACASRTQEDHEILFAQNGGYCVKYKKTGYWVEITKKGGYRVK